ncbi:hypothetical protein CEP14_04835 [Cylindrospermopsis raciborskii C04]|uniref:Uncharacterized protein n=1 Tax=Cylindrospermopsis raciborskii C07 TaxID=2014886 RepID=A0ABX4WQ10_9CYAN|nr:hypothetical protein [Cylindrospermopsis raciborskii]PNJ97152.1 hypothetical protein CEP13_03900 [Cylindrospermopsis raciborskii C03]PNJ98169.1 hypothetical protein CEP15_08745 [Cylindrospermopsis raciborskii C07]PNJ98387.1 hypothetical protein CEP14_04835 [Cylindrospermopsis raciborskii C04]
MSQDKKPRSKPQLPDTPPLGGYHKKPLFWKILIIQVLRGTIGILERMVTRLETSSSTTSEKGGLLLWVVRKWDGFLRGFRLFLPSKVANNVSDSFLTLIFVFPALLAIGVTAISLISQIHSQPVPQLGESIADSTVENKSELQLGESTSDSTVEDKSEPQLGEPTADSIVEGKSKPELSQPATDFILRSQSEIEPVELIPQPEVTVFIEKQLKEITAISIITKDKQRIELELVQSIKTNFRISEIVIKVNENWYKLESSQQEKLAAKILKSCQEMDLIHVKLVNARNQVIARSPVIGTKMLFFQFPTS